MATCLGLYIENNIIKYAKVSKDNDVIKIDAFGIKFYDKLEEAIQQVISETYSYKIPISINLSTENYNYFNVFSLLNKKDMQNVIDTEFEALCYEKSVNKEAFESRYVLVSDNSNKEQIKVMHVSANKADIEKKIQQLEGSKISSIAPIGISISNLLEFKPNENVMIVNIEDITTVTTIIDEKIFDVQKIENGTDEILSKINAKENSYSKAYEICKNTTIYTSEGKDLEYQENEYLEDIMPTLYNIVGNVMKIANESLNRIDKIYITGTASVINNIDIYFQEYLQNIKCEILKPHFVENAPTKINMKDYIQVNSALAIALQGLGDGIRNMNFKKDSIKDKLPEWMTMEVGSKKNTVKLKNNKKTKPKIDLKMDLDFKSALTGMEKNLLRTLVGIILVVIVYMGFSKFITNKMENKENEISIATQEVRKQISTVNNDIDKLRTNTNKYVSMIQKLEELNNKISDKNKTKNAIPNLLNQIMWVIPEGVQITSIENTTGTHIVINVQSRQYEQIGYLQAKIKTDGILTNVVSDSGQNQDGMIKVTIEGDLP